jgi:uncharacterized protein YqcC (DUF446 family)
MVDNTISLSPTGVRISDNFRDNLIIDKYHPCFVSMRQSKIKHLRSENSEDAISWNVFRTLRQIHPANWIPHIFLKSFNMSPFGDMEDTTIDLWRNVAPPSKLLKTGDEGISEIDVVIENPEWVWFIEAKYRSDISTGTTTRPDRDQVLRNIDVGSFYSGVRRFYFSLLILNEKRTVKGVSAVEKYKSAQTLKAALPHRTDELKNISGIGVLTWFDFANVLSNVASDTSKNESMFAKRAVEWLEERGIFRRAKTEKDMRVLAALEAIEAEMKNIGFWSENPPKFKPGSYLEAPSFEFWLQCVFLPNARKAANTGEYPSNSQVGLMAMREYDYHSCVEEALNLVRLLHTFDKVVLSK